MAEQNAQPSSPPSARLFRASSRSSLSDRHPSTRAASAPVPPLPSSAPPTSALKPIIKHSISYTGQPTMFSRSSSTTTVEEDTTPSRSSREFQTVRSSSSLPTRLPSPSPCLNVKFAPLPSIEPRKRKSNIRLGVAARSRMLQARRNGGVPPADWSDAQDAPSAQSPVVPSTAEDPLEVFARFMVNKTKKIFGRTQPPTTAIVVGTTERDLDTLDISAAGIEPDIVKTDELVSAVNEDSEGGIWEEQVGEVFQQRMKDVDSMSKDEKRSKRSSFLGKASNTT